MFYVLLILVCRNLGWVVMGSINFGYDLLLVLVFGKIYVWEKMKLVFFVESKKRDSDDIVFLEVIILKE